MSTLDLNKQIISTPQQTEPSLDNSMNDSFSPSTSSSPVRMQRTRRKSSEAALHSLNRRVIKKPKRNNIFTSTNDKDIRKFYLNAKLTNYKSTNLETIFEEEPNENHHNLTANTTDMSNCDSSFRKNSLNRSATNRLHSFIGGRKLRRSVSFSDGLNISKSTIQTRRKRIKRLFGRPLKLEKISMNEFLTHLRSFGYDTMTMTAVSSTTAALCDREPVETQSDVEISSCETTGLDLKFERSISNEV